MTYSNLTLPPRMLASVSIYIYLKKNTSEHTYKVKPNSFLMDQYLNMVIIPVIYLTPMQTDTIIPLIRINMSIESISLSKCKVLGILDEIDTEICEIMTSLALE